MAKYQRKPNTLTPFEANRFERGNQLVPGMWRGPDGCAYVTTIQGRDVEVSVGEWVIQEPDGIHYYPCADAIFHERYEEVPA